MSDNKDKPQTQAVSVDGFHAFGNPLDNTDKPIKHRKKQLPVKYYTRDIENDLGDGGPDFVQITAITMQYDIMVSAHLPVEHSDLLRVVANAMIYARLSKKGLEANNIELVDANAGENKPFSMSRNAKQAFDHALTTRGNIVGDTLSVMVSEAAKNKEVKLSTGQTWTHKQKGYDVEIDYINRTGDVVVEEVATGQRDGFGREVFLDRFSPKNKDSDA